MKNYSKITQNKDILTREYADSTYAKVNAENTFTAKQTINSGMGVVSLKTQGYVEIGASYTPKKDISGLFGFKDDGTGRIYAIVPHDLGFVERIKMNNSSIEPGNTGTVDLGTVLTAHQNIKTLNTNNTTSQTVNASESISGSGTINLHKVAKTGNYNDLSNTPSIPAAVTESTVSGWGFTKNTGTVTSVAVKMNGATKGTVTSSGTIDLGTVITEHQDISGKQDKITSTNKLPASLVSGLATVATSGSYTDLSNTPTILSEADVKGIKVDNATYADSAGYVKNEMVFQGVGMNADANYSNFVRYNGQNARSIKFYKYDFQMQDALGSGDAELTLRNTGVTAGTYNSVTVDTKGRVTAGTNTPAVDTSNLAKLDAENTFTKGQVITGGTSDGYSVKAGGYVKGSWLQSEVMNNKGSNTGKVCVFDGNGWIYYRTPSEILSEASGVPKSAFSLSGTTLTITVE